MVKLIVKIQRNLSKINGQDFARFDGILAESQYSGINSQDSTESQYENLPNLQDSARFDGIFAKPIVKIRRNLGKTNIQNSTESW